MIKEELVEELESIDKVEKKTLGVLSHANDLKCNMTTKLHKNSDEDLIEINRVFRIN